MASIKGFLTAYFKQLHFNAMPPEVRNRWEEYLGLSDLNNTMKDWRNQLMSKTTENGKDVYTPFGLPNIEKGHNQDREGDGKPGDPGLTEPQIEELYMYMNEAVSGMAEDKKLKNAEFATAKTFVDEFYGSNKLFNIVPLQESTCNKLTKSFTEDVNAKSLEVIIKNNLPEGLTYQEFIDGVKQKKYNVDAGFREKLKSVIDRLQYAGYQLTLNPHQSGLIEQIIALKDELDPKPASHNIERFKTEYGVVLNQLYKKSKVKELFAAHDQNGIISALDGAREAVNYDKEGDNFLEPKTKKVLNPAQKIKKKWDDFYDNRLAKWENLGGDRMFQSRAAEDIVKQIKKEKIKPTDGLAAILEKSETIKNNMPHTSVQTGKHFDWFIKEMNAIKKADDKSFDACLYDGISLRGVVQRLIRDAVKDDKIAEAKTALEILSVIKYENTTSKTLDAIKADKDLFNLFSSLPSLQNNEATKFVATALDKTIRIGGIAVATMATFAFNSIRKMGSKIKSENNVLGKDHQAQKDKWAQDKAALGVRIDASKNRRDKAEAKLAGMGKEDDYNKDVNEKQTAFDELDAAMKAIFDGDKIVDKNINDNLKALQDFFNNAAAPDTELMAVQKYIGEYIEYVRGESSIPPSISGIPKTCAVYDNVVNLNKTIANIAKLRGDIGTVKADLAKAQNAKQEFVNATNALNSANDEFTRNDEEMKNWDENHIDRYDELVKYWNKLEFGRDLHLGRAFGGHYSHLGSKENQQKKFYEKKNNKGKFIFNNGMPGKDAYQA